jgi:hypothetical protein
MNGSTVSSRMRVSNLLVDSPKDSKPEPTAPFSQAVVIHRSPAQLLHPDPNGYRRTHRYSAMLSTFFDSQAGYLPNFRSSKVTTPYPQQPSTLFLPQTQLDHQRQPSFNMTLDDDSTLFTPSPTLSQSNSTSPPSVSLDSAHFSAATTAATAPAPSPHAAAGRIAKRQRGGGAGRSKRMWTAEEDEMLRLVAGEHPENWNEIGRALPGRTGKQCRERWLNNLRPDIRKGEWTAAEDALIVREQARRGNQWSSIARLLVGRSDNAIKNRFASKLKKRAAACLPLPLPLPLPPAGEYGGAHRGGGGGVPVQFPNGASFHSSPGSVE